jgi:hypothetical protein
MNNETPDPIDVISQALREIANTRVTSQDVTFSDLRFLEFKAQKKENNYGKGMIFSGQGYTKKLVFNPSPDQFFSSEHINLDTDRGYFIGNTKVLDSKELGPEITKSNLKEVGRLKGLLVDGSVTINEYLFYNGACDRLGLGTEEPNAAFSVAENAIEVMLGTTESLHGMVGTFASTDFDIVTDNTARISVKANGNIDLGNVNRNPIQVKINGKLSIGVAVPDPAVDLHVAGAVRINNHIQMYASEPPKEGNYTVGDIVWNAAPRPGMGVGWVCIKAGNPGQWNSFGDVKERGN